MTFSVIDKATGEYPDLEKLASEEWMNNVCVMDIEGFAIEEDGTLVLLDECGNVAYCPSDRFEVVPYVVSNGDQIRTMTDEELADELLSWAATILAEENLTRGDIVNYLKKPVQEDQL